MVSLDPSSPQRLRHQNRDRLQTIKVANSTRFSMNDEISEINIDIVITIGRSITNGCSMIL